MRNDLYLLLPKSDYLLMELTSDKGAVGLPAELI